MKKLVLITLCLFFAGISYVHPHDITYKEVNGITTSEYDNCKKTDYDASTHFNPNEEGDPCFNFGQDCKNRNKRYDGGHGHKTGDSNDLEWGYWTCEAYKHLCGNKARDCPSGNGGGNGGGGKIGGNGGSGGGDVKVSIIDDMKSVIDTPHEDPETPIEQIIDEEPVEIIEPIEPDEPELLDWDFGWWLQGITFVSFPAMRPDIETIADLFAYYPFFETGKDAIYVLLDGEWYGYDGKEDQIAGDVPITPYLGVAIQMDYSVKVTMQGTVRLIGDGEVEIQPGFNLVGLTELPSQYQYPSDFLEIDGIQFLIMTHDDPYQELGSPRWFLIKQKGDTGDDIPLRLSQALLIYTYQYATIDFTEQTPSAPSAFGRLTTTWGAIKESQ